MKDKIFIDSNIFIYAKIQSQDNEKHKIAQGLLKNIKNAAISIQVISEISNVFAKMNIDIEKIKKNSR